MFKIYLKNVLKPQVCYAVKFFQTLCDYINYISLWKQQQPNIWNRIRNFFWGTVMSSRKLHLHDSDWSHTDCFPNNPLLWILTLLYGDRSDTASPKHLTFIACCYGSDFNTPSSKGPLLLTRLDLDQICHNDSWK